MYKKINLILIIILFGLSASLVTAYTIDYGFGYNPCKLCIYQRIPYIISIALLLNVLLIKKYIKTSLLILAVVFLCSSILAFYHFGIEQGFFSESMICDNKSISKDLSGEDLLKELKRNTVSCKEVTFRFLGMSLATINTIFSLILSAIFIKLFLNYEKN
tara:strand:- start:322 stop:801 length:480 start_codon:yes stop_codon:yes gene_type:complete